MWLLLSVLYSLRAGFCWLLTGHYKISSGSRSLFSALRFLGTIDRALWAMHRRASTPLRLWACGRDCFCSEKNQTLQFKAWCVIIIYNNIRGESRSLLCFFCAKSSASWALLTDWTTVFRSSLLTDPPMLPSGTIVLAGGSGKFLRGIPPAVEYNNIIWRACWEISQNRLRQVTGSDLSVPGAGSGGSSRLVAVLCIATGSHKDVDKIPGLCLFVFFWLRSLLQKPKALVWNLGRFSESRARNLFLQNWFICVII